MSINNLIKPLPLGLHMNKLCSASIWIGSYRIHNPAEHQARFPKPSRWPRYNELIQKPQVDPNEERRPATYHHYRENIKSSPKKMWFVAKFLRGLNVDEAIKQCSFMPNKPAQIAADVLKEAQDKAVREHDFEYKSKMWIEDCKIGKGLVIKGVRKHARMRYGTINYFYCHMMIKLTEGEPPVDFYRPKKDGNDLLRQYYDELRSRTIKQGIE